MFHFNCLYLYKYFDDRIKFWYFDSDGDGFGDSNNYKLSFTKPSGYVSNSFDCNDDDELIYPGAIEQNDNTDNNCDKRIDEIACKINNNSIESAL